MTTSKIYATCETGNVIEWDLLSQKQLRQILIREGIPTSSFDIFDNGMVASAGQKLFLRNIWAFHCPFFQNSKKWCWFIRFFFKEWLRQTLQTYSSSFSRFRLMITKIWLTGFASWFPDQFRKVLRFIWNLLIGKTCYQHFKLFNTCPTTWHFWLNSSAY